MFTIGNVRNSALEAAQIKRNIYEEALVRWQHVLEHNELTDDDYNMVTTLVDTLLTDLDRAGDDIRHIIGEDWD